MFKIKPITKEKYLGLTLYNKFFIHLKGDYYIPIFYNEDLFRKVLNSKYLFEEIVLKFNSEYFLKELKKYVSEVTFTNDIVNPMVHDYLIYKGLVGDDYSFLPGNIKETYKKLDKYFFGINPLWYLLSQYQHPLPKINGSPAKPMIYSNDLILRMTPDLPIDVVLRELDELYFGDFDLDLEAGVLFKFKNLFFDKVIDPTNNTAITFVYPYLYVRGQLDKTTAIVNKYKFIPKWNGFFKLVKSEIVNGIMRYGTKTLQYTKIKEFDSIKRVINSIHYFVHKGLIENNTFPLVYEDKVYLFIRAKMGDWVSKLNLENGVITINPNECKTVGGGFVQVKINNRTVSSYYLLDIATILDPGWTYNIKLNKEYCGKRFHPIRLR